MSTHPHPGVICGSGWLRDSEFNMFTTTSRSAPADPSRGDPDTALQEREETGTEIERDGNKSRDR